MTSILLSDAMPNPHTFDWLVPLRYLRLEAGKLLVWMPGEELAVPGAQASGTNLYRHSWISVLANLRELQGRDFLCPDFCSSRPWTFEIFCPGTAKSYHQNFDFFCLNTSTNLLQCSPHGRHSCVRPGCTPEERRHRSGFCAGFLHTLARPLRSASASAWPANGPGSRRLLWCWLVDYAKQLWS